MRLSSSGEQIIGISKEREGDRCRRNRDVRLLLARGPLSARFAATQVAFLEDRLLRRCQPFECRQVNGSNQR